MAKTIVFPTNEETGLSAKRGAHFGRARYYTVVRVGEHGGVESVESIKNPGHEAGGCGGAIENIRSLGADALVVSGIGASPLRGFIQHGVLVFYDNVSPTVESSLDALEAGRLTPMRPDMSCSHHTH